MTTPKTTGSERVDLPITGMTCASCANRIEKSLKKAEGVSDATVNLATERATAGVPPGLVDPQPSSAVSDDRHHAQ